jgi:hypothetical protein
MKKHYLPLFLILILCSCKTNLVYIKVLDPALVTVPGYVKTIGIINRSIPSDASKALNKVHLFNTAEGAEMAAEGSAECIRGLKDALMENTRFAKIVVLDSIHMKCQAIGMFNSPLSWDALDSICNANGLDAVFVLELFDTELKVSAPLVVPRSGVGIALAALQVSMNTTVRTGWRIYVPKDRFIPDEYTYTNTVTHTGTGNNIGAATEALIGRKEAVKQAANKAGHGYVCRVTPYWITVTRDYFIKGNAFFKMAMRKARTGNWDGAAELWEKETHNPRNKIAGRACYNMAIISEINGDLDKAIQWASIAYEEHGTRLALHYINQLKYRKNEKIRLQSQEPSQ